MPSFHIVPQVYNTQHIGDLEIIRYNTLETILCNVIDGRVYRSASEELFELSTLTQNKFA